MLTTSLANNKSLEPWAYLSDVYHEGYKIQMDFYGYLLSEMGHDVSETFYFLVCNANRKATDSSGNLNLRRFWFPINGMLSGYLKRFLR